MASSTPKFWARAKKELSASDPIMKKIIASYPENILTTRSDSFQTLLRSIVGQQISVKAAQSIWGRVVMLLNEEITPSKVLSFEFETLRACGLSQRKTEYMRDLATHFYSQNVKPELWANMSDEEIILELTQVRGIGRWTVEMFLIFHLLRPDVFPKDDIGMQRAISIQYKKRYPPSKVTLDKVGNKWKPWRSVATWYLWRSLDPIPVEY